MARTLNKLTSARVTKAKRKGYHSDGGGLFLYIGPTRARSWVFRFSSPTLRSPRNPNHGRPREMGLGAVHTIGLADAREKATECRKQLDAGIDPIEARKKQQIDARLAEARAMTFDQCATAYIEAHKAGWRNAKHADQWTNTLKTYATPVFGALPVQAIDTALVTKVISTSFWTKKTETANRVRGRIEAVLDWATTRGYRSGDNPARWRGHLENLLPRRAKVNKVRHHPALPYAQLGTFLFDLRAQNGVGALALEFTILTAARTGETIGAERSEVDFQNGIWTVPGHRIKGGKEHRVPLCARALAILEELKPIGGKFLFPGGKAGSPLSNMAMLSVLDRMGRSDLTVHGFRSTFRDWAAEQTGFPNEVVEMALAHVVGDKVEAAYRRGDLFDKRRKLMEAWATYCAKAAPVTGDVLPLRRVS